MLMGSRADSIAVDAADRDVSARRMTLLPVCPIEKFDERSSGPLPKMRDHDSGIRRNRQCAMPVLRSCIPCTVGCRSSAILWAAKRFVTRRLLRQAAVGNRRGVRRAPRCRFVGGWFLDGSAPAITERTPVGDESIFVSRTSGSRSTDSSRTVSS